MHALMHTLWQPCAFAELSPPVAPSQTVSLSAYCFPLRSDGPTGGQTCHAGFLCLAHPAWQFSMGTPRGACVKCDQLEEQHHRKALVHHVRMRWWRCTWAEACARTRACRLCPCIPPVAPFPHLPTPLRCPPFPAQAISRTVVLLSVGPIPCWTHLKHPARDSWGRGRWCPHART